MSRVNGNNNNINNIYLTKNGKHSFAITLQLAKIQLLFDLIRQDLLRFVQPNHDRDKKEQNGQASLH